MKIKLVQILMKINNVTFHGKLVPSLNMIHYGLYSLGRKKNRFNRWMEQLSFYDSVDLIWSGELMNQGIWSEICPSC